MNLSELDLVPLEDLIKEIEKRTEHFVLAYTLPDDKGAVTTCWAETDKVMLLGLASYLRKNVEGDADEPV